MIVPRRCLGGRRPLKALSSRSFEQLVRNRIAFELFLVRIPVEFAIEFASDVRQMADGCAAMTNFHGRIGNTPRSNAVEPVLQVRLRDESVTLPLCFDLLIGCVRNQFWRVNFEVVSPNSRP